MAISLSSLTKPIEKIIEAINSLQGVSGEVQSGNESLINSLKEMESAYANKVDSSMPDYESTLPATTNATMKTYDEKSEEELLAEATTLVTPTYTEKINDLNEKTDTKVATLQSELASGEQELTEGAAEAESDYTEDNFSATGNAVKQGISASSIYTNVKKSILDEYKSEITALTNEYTALSESIEKEITLLNQSKENALLEYDLEQASAIEKQLSTLKSSQQTAIASVNKYNQQLTEAEEEYQTERAETITSLQEQWRTAQEEQLAYEQVYGYTGDNLTEMNSRYDLAKSFYLSVSKSDANKLLTQNAETLKSSLGESYYAKLVEENNNR